MAKIVNETVLNITSVLPLITNGTATFVISGATFYSVLNLSINRSVQDLKGFKVKFLQNSLYDIILIIIDEI